MNMKNGWVPGAVVSALLVTGFVSLAFASAGSQDALGQFGDVLDIPALRTERVPKIEMVGIARAGKSWVAVGARGRIIRSEDEGASWRQATSPVSADLTSVFFVNDLEGWSVGHDSLILHTSDAGKTWRVQLDGRSAAKLLKASYAKLLAEGVGYASNAESDLEHNFAASGGKPIVSTPLMDVWFANPKQGFAVGAFNSLFMTSDGGTTWVPADHLTDNPKGFHLHAIRGSAAGVFIAGEQGMVLRWDESVHRFVSLPTGYSGTYLGVLNTPERVLAYGLRGNARESRDGGKTWSEVRVNSTSSIVNALALRSGSLLLVLQDGSLYTYATDGRIQRMQVPAVRTGEVFGAELVDDRNLITTGLRGPMSMNLPNVPL